MQIREVSTVSERDWELLNALQIAPRASWRDLAEVLGSSPSGLAARWDRLRASGTAWVTAHPAGMPSVLVAMIEVDCLPGARDSVADALCADPRALTIEECARGFDLLVTVMTKDLAELGEFVLNEFPRIGGISRQRTHLVTRTHLHGARWRLDSLDADHRSAVERLVGTVRAQPTALPPDYWPLIEALAWDGRATSADLARRTGRNAATVRRQLPRLLASGLIAFRCEVAQGKTRWPVNSTWFARVAPADRDRTVATLTTLPELRLCVSTTGATNLMFTVWTDTVADLLRLEALFAERMPWLRILDNTVNLRTRKRMGWLLGEHGINTGTLVVSTALRGREEQIRAGGN